MTEERQPTRFTVWKCSKCGYEATQPFTRQHLTNTYRYCGEKPEKTDLVPASELDKALAALRESDAQFELLRENLRLWRGDVDRVFPGAENGRLAIEARKIELAAETGRDFVRDALKALDGLREPA